MRSDAMLKEPGRVLRQAAGDLRRWAQSTVDRSLHASRRRRAERNVRRIRPRSVLMVCFGNICRSPFAAEALSRVLAGHQIVVDSAGFFGPHRSSPAIAQSAAAALAIDLTSHRSKLFTAAMLHEFDLIAVMEAKQRRGLVRDHGVPGGKVLVLGDLDPEAISMRTIADPYGQSPDAFAECYQRLQRCVGALASILLATPEA